MCEQMPQEVRDQVRTLAESLEVKLDTARVLADITLDNAVSAECAEGAYLDSRRAGALMQAQIYLSDSIFEDFCKLMDMVDAA